MTLFILGDSTAACYGPDMFPFMGWGQALAEMWPDQPIVNAAKAGRSTKTFLEEGRLEAVRPQMKPGDLVIIQFGHNDEGDKPERHTEAYGDFTDNLRFFVNTVKEMGAQPLLMTPTCVRCFKDGVLQSSLGIYPQAIRDLAAEMTVPMIDMHAMTSAHVAALGDAESRTLYMNLEPGVYPNFPEGRTDDTHTLRKGAETYAGMVADALKAMKLV